MHRVAFAGRWRRGAGTLVLVIALLGLDISGGERFLLVAYGQSGNGNGDPGQGADFGGGVDGSTPSAADPQSGGVDALGGPPGSQSGEVDALGGPPGSNPEFGGEGKPGGEVAPDQGVDPFGGITGLFGSQRSMSVADAVQEGFRTTAENSLLGLAWNVVTSFFNPQEGSTRAALNAFTNVPASDSGKAQLGTSVVGALAGVALTAAGLGPIGWAVSALAIVTAVVIGVVSALSK